MSWMTQTEAAVALGCSIRTVRRRIRSGAINARREGRRLLIDVDTDRAMSTVTQVGRHLAEVGAAAAIQRRHDADALSTIHATFKDTLATLADCREQAAHDVGAYRRSARWGWTTTSVLGVAIVAMGWFIHSQRLAHESTVHRVASKTQASKNASDTAFITAEIRHTAEMSVLTAKQKAVESSLYDVLDQERATVTSLEQRLDATSQALAERNTDLRLVTDERDRLAHGNEQDLRRLQVALFSSKLAGYIKSFWTTLQSSEDRSSGRNRADDLRTVLSEVAATHSAALTALQHGHERELRSASTRQERVSDALRSSLEDKEDALRRLEQRNNELADKLIAAVTERSYLAAERDRLVRRIAAQQTELDRLGSAE